MHDYMIGIFLSAAFAFGGFFHEFTWRRHLTGSEIITGRIVGEVRGRNGMLPKVAYTFRGTERHFTSKYRGGKIHVGEKVSVAYNPDSGTAEVLSNLNRWVWTIVPVGLSVVVIVGTFLKFQ